ncbi:carboxypeptidase-like regulatory domain-containing protein [Blastopirellula sp. J2-11]|uniref:carboxypeptidase-like regulatory domain-containing protein n=1 Tax=Blastopirellula sp. J2-11 TaxID=2943192 RepID=UPI0021CA50FE|nr:carboxypeptidase-like regulatory domain-containing protein [Blastopirellula sp. J2-11]UUO08543.1 carboxypeptidase-like regulatory domain-containing protein [Blastopirellula sp. J2-11]
MLDFQRTAIPFVVLTFIGIALASGCGSQSDLHAVGGEVTMDGAPAAGAIISFQAVAGSLGNSSGAVVDQQGRYSIPSEKGLKAGAYDVTIQYWKETGETYTDPCTGQTTATTAPVKFAQQGKLRVDVKADEEGQFDFALTSAKK